MTRRIRDFMYSANNVDPSNEFNTSGNANSSDYNNVNNRNFGVALSKCEPSSMSCVCI